MLRKISKIIQIFKSEPDLLITFPFGIIFFILIYCSQNFFAVRVGFIHNQRIGHFAGNLEVYLTRKKYLEDNKQKRKSIDIFYSPETKYFNYYHRKTCNAELEKLWKKKLIVFPRILVRPICLLVRFFKLSNLHCGSEFEDRDSLNLFDLYEPSLKFSEEQILYGENEKELLGIPRGKKFVCLIVRDELFLETIYKNPNKDILSIHKFRNTNLQNYISACEFLTTKGYYVLRMGVHAKDKINTDNKMIIDYAYLQNTKRTEFMDIYLGANCDFCISSMLGFDAIPYIFRKPILFINGLPIAWYWTFSNKFFILPRNLFSTKLNRNLKLKEILNSDIGYVYNSNIFNDNSIIPHESSEEEILEAAKEMVNYLNKNSKIILNNNKQEKYWEIFSRLVKQRKNDTDNPIYLHGKIKSQVSNSFLKNNPDYLT